MNAHRWIAMTLVSATLAACSKVSQHRDGEVVGQGRPEGAPAPSKAFSLDAVAVSEAPAAVSEFQLTDSASAVTVAAPSMIIRNGHASVEVAELDVAIAAVRDIAQRVGGYVANTSMVTGRDQIPSATIELKVPAVRFDSAMSGLQPLGKVESINTTAEDVGEHFVDVTARLANARRLESRIQNILATRTGKLEDIIAAERELARVRQEIERYEGRLRYLNARLAMSTINVTVHEPYPVVGGPGTGPIAQAFKNLWRNFVLFVAWLIASLGWMLPAAGIVVVIWLGARKYVRRRRTVTPVPQSA